MYTVEARARASPTLVMGKRPIEEQEIPDRIPKKVKKEKKHRSATADAPDAVNGVANTDHVNISHDAKSDGLSKEERKALKRARKEAARSVVSEALVAETVKDSGYSSPATKEERKALKRALKEARKAERLGEATQEQDATATGTTDGPYEQHEGLSALPQSEIDAFVAEHQLTIEDPLKDSYRPITSFKYLPVKDESDRAPFAKFSSPTPIQASCWPYLLASRDVVGVAETGSGKTLAFGVPCIRHIERLSKKERRNINACIVSPTRELAVQIYDQLSALAASSGLKATCVYGGTQKDVQRASIPGTNILVATPGRLNDFIQDGTISLSAVTYLVLDEADRMLDKGFEDDVRKIISQTSPAASGRQTLMFTATWPPSVRDLASTFMRNPVKVTIGDNASGELRANTRIEQTVEVIADHEKQPRLIEILKTHQSGSQRNDRILVFCLYKKEATRIEEFIRRRGFNVAGIHGDMNQAKRMESLEAFKAGRVPLLVATDVAARGLDIPAVKVVVNVTFPLTVEDYVHRIGR